MYHHPVRRHAATLVAQEREAARRQLGEWQEQYQRLRAELADLKGMAHGKVCHRCRALHAGP